ncbi:type IX secretion system membrane protein PorP/SprF [Labilibacter sediminis]|nr:type IX secretion system membrane protein PorP/SprF [Labilibacter sediminis]
MKKNFLIIFIVCIATVSFAQKEVRMSQYMYNKYVINPAFGGSHEALSLFGSFRKQWIGIENSPQGAFFSMHSPLNNEKVALGIQVFSENIAVANNTGFNASYTYRIKLANEANLALGVSAGLVNYKSNWSDVALVDPVDEAFGNTEQSMAPWLGFGVGVYHNKYFAGFSIPSFLFHDRFGTGDNSLDFASIDYLLTAGYLFQLSSGFSIQPSSLIRINGSQKSYVDMGCTGVLMNALMIGVSYRTTNEVVGILGYQVTPQFRFTYSLDYDIDPIGSYNNGTHEIAIQFDFGYKINTPNPKFF